MSKIRLTDGFSIIPEGTQVFKIVGVEHDETFGKLQIFLETEKGQKHTERFKLINDSGQMNDGAMKAFSYFARVALNDFTVEDVETDDLVGHFIECEVKHEEYTATDGTVKKAVRLGDKKPANGFTTEQPKTESYNLDDILG